MIKVISGFAGIGKTYFSQTNYVNDSDSSKYKCDNFPNLYISHIKKQLDRDKLTLVSCHDIVRDQLVNNGINFYLVYPTIEQKDMYIERYKQRGSPESFINLLSEKWEEMIESCISQKNCTHVVLTEGQYLSEVIYVSVNDNFELFKYN